MYTHSTSCSSKARHGKEATLNPSHDFDSTRVVWHLHEYSLSHAMGHATVLFIPMHIIELYAVLWTIYGYVWLLVDRHYNTEYDQWTANLNQTSLNRTIIILVGLQNVWFVVHSNHPNVVYISSKFGWYMPVFSYSKPENWMKSFKFGWFVLLAKMVNIHF